MSKAVVLDFWKKNTIFFLEKTRPTSESVSEICAFNLINSSTFFFILYCTKFNTLKKCSIFGLNAKKAFATSQPKSSGRMKCVGEKKNKKILIFNLHKYM